MLRNRADCIEAVPPSDPTPKQLPQEQLPKATATIAIPGPSFPTDVDLSTSNTPSFAPLSPYSSERQRVQELTMPTVPNFDIPDSPPPPPMNSEEAATLAAATRKFERFLELKKQGVHFHDRLQKSAALRNPTLLPKLMEFAGMTQEESYASTLPADLGVPTRWAADQYVDELVRANERREKKRKEGRDKIDFVSAAGGAKSSASSAVSTPNKSHTVDGDGKRSRFDNR